MEKEVILSKVLRKIKYKLVNNVNEFKLNNFTDEKVAEKYINNFNIVLKKFKEI